MSVYLLLDLRLWLPVGMFIGMEVWPGYVNSEKDGRTLWSMLRGATIGSAAAVVLPVIILSIDSGEFWWWVRVAFQLWCLGAAAIASVAAVERRVPNARFSKLVAAPVAGALAGALVWSISNFLFDYYGISLGVGFGIIIGIWIALREVVPEPFGVYRGTVPVSE